MTTSPTPAARRNDEPNFKVDPTENERLTPTLVFCVQAPSQSQFIHQSRGHYGPLGTSVHQHSCALAFDEAAEKEEFSAHRTELTYSLFSAALSSQDIGIGFVVWQSVIWFFVFNFVTVGYVALLAI